MSRRRGRRKGASPHPPGAAERGRKDRSKHIGSRSGRLPIGTPEGDARGCLALCLLTLSAPVLYALFGLVVGALGVAAAILIALIFVVAVAIALFSLCSTLSV
jgi:hypothetical protein